MQPVGITDPVRYLLRAAMSRWGTVRVDFSTGQPTAYYPPGYPLFVGAIAAVLRPFGLLENWLPQAVALVQAVLGAASVYLLGLLGRSLLVAQGWADRCGDPGADPNLVMHTAGVLGETLYIFLLVAALYVLLAVPFSSWSLRQGVLRAGDLVCCSAWRRWCDRWRCRCWSSWSSSGFEAVMAAASRRRSNVGAVALRCVGAPSPSSPPAR